MMLAAVGAELNVAIGMARLGHKVGLVGVVGSDPFGDLVLRTLRAEGVDVEDIRVIDEANTGLITFDRPAGNVLSVNYFRHGSAGSFLGKVDGEKVSERAPRIVHVTGVTAALSDSARAATDVAMRAARASGALVSLDLNYRAKLWSRKDAGIALRDLARNADIIFASEEELDLLLEGPGDDALERIQRELPSFGVEELIVTRGALGASAFVQGSEVTVDAFPAVAVDTIGAGDAFVAGYLSALVDGASVTERMARARVFAAFAVTRSGDWEGLPSRAQLDAATQASEHIQR
ncbi:sugar kinase [Salinibacterium sp. G-O1]|uniref:sugar kinase n=1 Tax=Salinibacterium sp. G-O1 TaxID=3046208 RepID=UPI0024B8DA09|nr:sugar kinase [Salinibacterium sp. G-O1]MDJ0336088.1 sugar kinase [Salinibacterium sp. G-O1]